MQKFRTFYFYFNGVVHVQCYQNSDSQIYDVFNSVISIVTVWMIAILLY